MRLDHRFFVLDYDDRIVHVSEEYHETMGRFLGHSVWEYLPGAEKTFRAPFEEARRTGRPVEATLFYAGGLVDLRIVRSGDSLRVEQMRRTNLDFRTLGTLAAGLRRIEEELADRAPEQHDPRALASLRVLP